MIKCVKCSEVDAIAKAGIVRGKQRYYCSRCDYYFTFSILSADCPPPRRHPATIVDIARELQVSKSTVSRALHGHSDINEGTRQAVLDMAKKLDYQPNLLAYSLAKSKTQTIGIIVPEFINSFFPYVIIGAQEIANPAGYHVIICQSNESLQTEIANTNVLMASRVDGVLASLTGETSNVEHFQKFERAGIPVVYFNRVHAHADAPKVVVDDYEGAYKGVEHLIENGCRRIAHIAGPLNLQIGQDRLRGYCHALQAHGLAIDESLIVYHDLSHANALACAARLLDLPQRPDGVFALNDPAAITFMQYAKKRGVSIPNDIAVVGFSNEPTSALIEPGLTTLAQPMDEIGKTAVRILLERIGATDNDESTVAPTIVLKTKLIVRGSSLRQVTA